MEKKQELTKYQKIIITLVWALLIIAGIVALYMIMSISTMKISGQADCKINQIQYQWMNKPVICVAVIETNESKLCSIPNDIHCKGTMQDFPITRFLIEASQ